ncbi:MAG: hypothetical protein IJU66_06870 [Oscillospiraceae bacterium]|nr:hypothetical protein [Oscillospiraceae bacterium]
MNRKLCIIVLSALSLLCFFASRTAEPAAQAESAASYRELAALPEPAVEPAGETEPATVEDAEPAPDPEPALDLEAVPELVAHAGGAVYGYRLTNSLEALDLAYANGFRFVEVDMCRSADGELVLIHDWLSMGERMLGSSDCLTRAEFLSRPALAGLTLLDLDGLLDWLARHPDCSVITDVKEEDNLQALEDIRAKADGLVDHFIPQIYDYVDYTAAAELGYPRVILTLYRLPLEVEQVAAFVGENHPWAIAVGQDRLSEELLSAICDACPQTHVFAHSVNDLSVFEAWSPLGLTGIYTDYFQPAHWDSKTQSELPPAQPPGEASFCRKIPRVFVPAASVVLFCGKSFDYCFNLW